MKVKSGIVSIVMNLVMLMEAVRKITKERSI